MADGALGAWPCRATGLTCPQALYNAQMIRTLSLLLRNARRLGYMIGGRQARGPSCGANVIHLLLHAKAKMHERIFLYVHALSCIPWYSAIKSHLLNTVQRRNSMFPNIAWLPLHVAWQSPSNHHKAQPEAGCKSALTCTFPEAMHQGVTGANTPCGPGS